MHQNGTPEVCDSVCPKENNMVHSQSGCGSVEDKETPLLSSKISSCFQRVSVSVLGSHLVKCSGSKSRKHRCTYWCMCDTVFWIHMLFCIKNKLPQDYEYIFPTIFPSLFPATLSIFICTDTMTFIFPFCYSKLCILGLLHEKERKWTSSFPAIELNERSNTCFTYFPYPCKSNSAALLSWETEKYSLIYRDVKRSQIFAQFNWLWAGRNWFILHNSKLLKASIFH